MLMLYRKLKEGIYLTFEGGEVAKVIVDEIRKSSVRIRVGAPLSISVLREELLQELIANNKPASSITSGMEQGYGNIVLTRRMGERIVLTDSIGCNVKIALSNFSPVMARLCIEAPSSVFVARKEGEIRGTQLAEST